MHPKALVHHQAGLNYQQQGNLRAAAEEYEKALAIDARLDLTRTNLAGVLYQLGEYAGAIEHYRGVLEVQADNLKVVYNLGVAYSAAGQLTEAVSNFLRCLKLDPNFLPALTSLNWIYQQQENTVGAITVLTQIARLTPEDHATRYQLAVMLKDNQRDTEAIARLKELVADHPGHLAGRLLLADLQAIPDAENAWEQLSEIWTRDQGFVGSRDLGERIARNAADRAAKGTDPKTEANWLERLLKLRNRDAQVLRRLADLYRSLDRTTRAIQLYQDLADIRPDDADPQILLAQCLRRTGKRTEAQAALSKVLQAHPSHTGALLALADIRLEADRADQAEGLLQRALACDPSLIDARIQLAHVQAKLGRDEEAYEALRALVREQPTHYELRKGGAGLCRKLATAHQRAAAGEIPDATGSTSDAARENAAVQALVWWERYLEFVPEDVKVLELLGALYRQRQAHRDASRIYERLVTLKPEPAIWLLFGSCLMAGQEPGKAADAFAQAISRMPEVPPGTKDDSVPARASHAEALEAAGRTAEAVTAAQDALARDPQHAIAREIARRGSMVLAEAATAAGQHNEAAARWKYALHLGSGTASQSAQVVDPVHTQALRRYAVSLEAAGDPAGAEQAYLEVLRFEPDDRVAKHWLGERCLATRRPEEARKWFREVLKHDPQHLGAMTALADLAWAAGDRSEAYDLYERIVERDPAHIAGVLTFARDALAADQPLEAWEYSRRILAKHPGQDEAADVATAALRMLAEASEPAQAIEWYQRLINLHPDDGLALRGLWQAYRKLGSILEAARVAGQILEADPQDAELALFLADHEKRSGNGDRAREILSPAAFAGDSDCLLKLAQLEREARNWPAVRECLKRVLGFRPKHPEALEGLAAADVAEGRYPEAWGHVEDLIFEDVASPEVRALAAEAARQVGHARQTAGNAQEAAGWFRRALQAMPGDEEALHSLFALQKQLASPEAAAQVARGILAKVPGNREAALYLAGFLVEKSQGQEAADILAPVKDDPDAAYLLARIAWDAEDVSKARVHLAEVRRQVPRHLDAARLLASVAKAEANWEEAWNALHEVLALSPEDREAAEALTQLCRDAADLLIAKPDQAAGWLRRLVVLHPDDLDARADLAHMLSKAGFHGEAADVYKGLGERSEFDPRWPTLEGDELRLCGRLSDAEAALHRARLLAPEDPATALSLAQLAEQADKPEEAYSSAVAALKLISDDAEARRIALHSALRLAERARIQGDMEAVALHLENATKHDPDDPQLWRALGEARRLAGLTLRAAAAYARLWERVPEDLDSAFMAAELFRAGNDLPTARQLYLGILERDAGHRETLLTLARLLWQEEDRNGARWYLGRILAELDAAPASESASESASETSSEARPGPRSGRDDQRGAPAGTAPSRSASASENLALRRKVLSMLAAIAWQEGSYSECFDRAGQAMALSDRDTPDFKQARGLRLRAAHKLAILADHEESPTVARKWWQEVAKLDPADRIAFRRLADLAMDAGEVEEATRMFRVLWETDSADSDAALRLGEGLLSLGRRDEARQAYEEAAARTAAPGAAVALARMAHEDADPEAAWRWAETALGHRELAPTEPGPGQDDEDEAARAQRELRFERERGYRRGARDIAADAALALALRAQDAGNREAESLWWNRLSDLDATGRHRLLPLARGQARCGDPVAAAGTLLRLWDEDQTDIDVARELAETLLAGGDLEGALLNFRRVAELSEGQVEWEAVRENALLTSARLCVENGRAEEAWERSQALLAMRPDHAEARDLSAQCALGLAEDAEREQDFDSALLYRQVYLALRPGDRLGSLKLAGIHLAAGRRDQAIALFQDLLGRLPGDTEARLCLADALRPQQPETARGHYEEVLEAEPRNIHALASLADLAVEDKELEVAFGLRGRAAEAADDPVPHWLIQSELSWELGQVEQAWTLVQQVFERVPSHPKAIELGAACCRKLALNAQSRGDLRTARNDWESLLEILPADLEAIREVGRIARETGDLEAAQDYFTRAMALEPEDRSVAYQLGLLKLARMDVDGARHTFSSILEKDPHHADTLLSLAELAWNDGDPEGSWYYTQEFLALQPTHPKGLLLFTELSKTFAKRSAGEGDLKTSVQWWTLAHKQVSHDVDVLRNLADTKAKIGDLEGAADGYQRLMDFEPEDLDIAHTAAEIFRRMGNMAKAEAALTRVVELDPRHEASLRLLMFMAKERGDAKDVMRRAYDILDHDPADPEAMFELAWAHNALLEKKAALQTYEELLSGDPHHAESWHQVAQLHRDLGDLEPARKAATNAIVYGARPDYHVTLGTVYSRLGQVDEAIAAFNQALNLDPDHPEGLAQLGFVLLQQRKPDQAKPHLEKAITLLPQDSDQALEIRCALDLL